MFTKPIRGIRLNKLHPLSKGLVGCWLLNEGNGDRVFDLTGYGNHGIFATGTAAPTWILSSRGFVLNFGGIEDYVNCGTNPCLNITSSITLEIWVKLNEVKVACLLGKFLTTDNRAYIIHSVDGGAMRFYISSDGSGLSAKRSHFTTTNTFTSLTDWYHIVAVYIPSIKQELYINGINQPGTLDGTIQSKIHISPDPIIFGQMVNDYFFNGAISEVKIYNRALCLTEIQQLYKNPYCMFESIDDTSAIYKGMSYSESVILSIAQANKGRESL